MIKIIFGTAISIAAVAGFFSIYGLGNIYSAMFWSVVLMGTVLEAGKLVAVSVLYQFWPKFSQGMRGLGFFFIFGLMVITSAGVFGYLSNAYQQDSVDLKDVAVMINDLEQEKIELDEREAQIDEDIGRIGANYITKRMEMIDKYKPEKEYLSERRKELRVEIRELKSKQLEVEAHTGPIIYIAKALGKDVDTAIIWMTILIVVVFDPLAVWLTLAGNIAMGRRDEEEPEDDPKLETYSVPALPIDEEADAAVAKMMAEQTPTSEPEPITREEKSPMVQMHRPKNRPKYQISEPTPREEKEQVQECPTPSIDEPNPSVVTEEQLDELAEKHIPTANVNSFRERKQIDNLLASRKKDNR